MQPSTRYVVRDAGVSTTQLDHTYTSTLEPGKEISAQDGTISSRVSWLQALKNVLPIYLAIHLAFFLLTYLSVLFTLGNFSTRALRISTLLHVWYRWDSGHFTSIATKGYDLPYRTAFFPLYPLLEGGLTFLTRDAFVAGLIISNLAGLGMLTILYRLVAEDFDAERAYRSALYLSIFPTAFFFAAAYNESLFLLLALLSFYCMRHGHWWLAGLAGFLASLTRSAGLLLLVPFIYEYYEYWRQHDFRPRAIRIDLLGALGIPAGTGVFALYCLYRFHNALAFSQAQSVWLRHLHGPWHGLLDSFLIVTRTSILSFNSIHNVIDLSAGLFILALTAFGFIGPWKFPRHLLSYGLYGGAIYLFLVVFPSDGTFPLQSLSRLVLEVFPAFIVLAAIGKNRQFNLYYLVVSVTLLAFMLLQFLTGGWIV